MDFISVIHINIYLLLFLLTELITLEPRTLEDLFPGCNGVMLPVEELRFKDRFQNLKKFGDKSMIPSPHLFFKRDHIIFGWKDIRRSIGELCRLFGLPNLSIVFDTKEDKWVTLPRDLYQKLGQTRILSFVIARDQIAATHVSTSRNSIYKKAHLRACRQANDLVDIVEQEQKRLYNRGKITIGEGVRKIKEEYSKEYNRALAVYLYPRGDYNLNGYRRSHPEKNHSCTGDITENASTSRNN